MRCQQGKQCEGCTYHVDAELGELAADIHRHLRAAVCGFMISGSGVVRACKALIIIARALVAAVVVVCRHCGMRLVGLRLHRAKPVKYAVGAKMHMTAHGQRTVSARPFNTLRANVR
jgi:hypothetical protein